MLWGHSFLCNQPSVSSWESCLNEARSHSFQFRRPPMVTFGLQVTALTLLKEEDFPSLGYLLDREFRPLSHLLVLLGWTHCQSLESAKRLLQTLHRTQVSQSAPHGPPEANSMRLRASVEFSLLVSHSVCCQVPESWCFFCIDTGPRP